MRFIHEPWTMSPEERSKFGALGVLKASSLSSTRGYPAPCLDPSRFRDDGGSRPKKGRRSR